MLFSRSDVEVKAKKVNKYMVRYLDTHYATTEDEKGN